MSLRTLLAACVIAVAAAPFAPAAGAAESVTLNVKAMDDQGTDYYFVVDGYDGRNPTIVLPPGATVTVNFENVGEMVHNFRVGDPVDESTAVLEPGKSETLTFTVPESATGEGEYWCDPHQGLGMGGKVEWKASGTGDGGGEGNATDDPPQESTPAPAALLVAAAAIGAALLIGRRRRAE